MSTKDLLERLQRTAQSRTTRKPPARPGNQAEDGKVQTRVGDGVIRRRKVRKKPAAEAGPLPSAAPATRTVRRRPAEAAAPPAPEPVLAEAAPAVEAPVAEAPAPEAPAAEPVAQPPVTEAEPAAADAAAGPAANSEPDAARAADPAPAEEAAPQPDAAPEPTTTPEPAATEAAPIEDVAAEAPPAPEPVADFASAPDPAVAPTAEGDAAEVSAAASIAAGLPRADGSRPNAPVSGKRPLPGLGLGVIAPPPGYDPDDPNGNRARAQRAAEEARVERERSRAPRAGTETGERVWRDERAAVPGAAAPRGRGGPAGRGASGRPATAGRRGRKGRQQFDMYDGFGASMRRRRGKKSGGPKKASPQAKAIKRRVEMDEIITVSQLAHAMSVKSGQVIKTLMGMGQMATANQPLDYETASLVAEEFEFEVINASFQEGAHMIELVQTDEDLEGRPPVVTIMGHVDHGKTTLLDTIRKANVAAGEAGGITQHVSAYQVERNGQTISFIDTPGHAAFTAMRARGAEVTDIVVLVVAADDGVMPQTVEVINHAKAADVEIIVALNKCDRPESNPAKVKQQLLEYELVPEEYGGETLMVEVSALKGDGIDDLLDAILLISEMAEYQANPTRHAEGTVIEARLERGRGPVATVLVQDGTLKRGDRIVVGEVWGRIRAMTDANGKNLKEAGPSTPVEIMGLNEVPSAGDNMVVVKDDKAAKTLAEHRAEQARQKAFASRQKVTLEDLMARGAAGEILSLNLIIKADVNGSLEALQGSFAKVDVEGTDVKVLHSAVGAVSESDVTLAHTNNAVIIGFNVRPDAKARRAADEYGVQVRTYKVIYEAIEDVEKAMKGLLGPTIEEVVQGTAEIRQTFGVPKVGTVAGCMVTEGSIARSHQIRLLRDGTIVWEGRLGSLRRFKDDVREVQNGYECGMNLDGFNDIKVGDILEAYTKEEVAAD